MKKMSMFALLLAAVLVTSYSVSGTYAKYTSTFTGADSARVAKWAFSINDTKMTTETFTFDLFNTIVDESSLTNETETNILASDGSIIAPGTEGSFKIKLANNSEVDATYAIDYTVTNTAGIPVEFSIDGNNWTKDLADVAATQIDMNGSEVEINIQWRWTYDAEDRIDALSSTTDTTDTNLGSAAANAATEEAAPKISVQAVITATQID